MREIKFRAWDKYSKCWLNNPERWDISDLNDTTDFIWLEYTGLHDATKWEQLTTDEQNKWIKKGKTAEEWKGREIYEGDIIQFSNKREWYRFDLHKFDLNKFHFPIEFKGWDSDKWLDTQPYERRIIELPDCYLWLTNNELKQYWEVIGNIFENPELLEAE